MLTLNYSYRIYPNLEQEKQLDSWLEICRSVYNYGLREIKDWLNSRSCQIERCSLEREYIMTADYPFPEYHKQQDSLPDAKKQFPHLRLVPSQVLQTTIRRLHVAWQYFRSRGFGFPRFKKVGQFKSILFPQFTTNPITGYQIKLPKIGNVLVTLHRPIPEGFVVKQVRIIKKADKWYAVISIENDVNIPEVKAYGRAVGIDVGLEKFLATSEGFVVIPAKFFREMQSKLKLLQRRLSRKKRRSKNYNKARIKVARMHHDIANTRKDFHYKQAHAVCDLGDSIFVEDLDFRITAKGFLGKQMLDGAFGQFREITKQVCFKRGKFFAEVSAYGTSQECPECNSEVRKDLRVRIHQCPECKYTTDRDVASAQVIRNRGVEKYFSTPGLGGMQTACAEDLPGTGKIQSRQNSKPRKGKTRKTQS